MAFFLPALATLGKLGSVAKGIGTAAKGFGSFAKDQVMPGINQAKQGLEPWKQLVHGEMPTQQAPMSGTPQKKAFSGLPPMPPLPTTVPGQPTPGPNLAGAPPIPIPMQPQPQPQPQDQKDWLNYGVLR
jgi:hypothetical protein